MLICKTPKRRGTKFECGECGLRWKDEYDAMECCGKHIENGINMVDNVNHPPHYTSGGIETIDYIQAKLSREEFVGYCKANIIKYLSRGPLKGKEAEDYRKAQWYCQRLVKVIEDGNLERNGSG